MVVTTFLHRLRACHQGLTDATFNLVFRFTGAAQSSRQNADKLLTVSNKISTKRIIAGTEQYLRQRYANISYRDNYRISHAPYFT